MLTAARRINVLKAVYKLGKDVWFADLKALIRAMGLLGVVACLASRRSGEFESHMVQTLDFRNLHVVSVG